MTSGQGSDPGGQYGPPQGQPGPPQGWGAPPAAPPYGQQYPGYGPAPSAPTGQGAPQALERPTTVRAGLGAFLASLALGLVGALVTALNWDTVVGRTLADARTELGAAQAEMTGDTAEVILQIGLVLGVGFAALQLMFIWFAWKGHNWARIVLWVLGGLGAISGLAGMATGSPLPFLAALSVFQAIFLGVGVVLLALKPSNDWYRYRGWQRSTGQG